MQKDSPSPLSEDQFWTLSDIDKFSLLFQKIQDMQIYLNPTREDAWIKAIDRLETELTVISGQLREIGERLTNVEKRLTNVEERLTKVEERLTNVEERLTNVEDRLTKVEKNVSQLQKGFTDFRTTTIINYETLSNTIHRIEKNQGRNRNN